jgi:hypothetical protein
MQWWCRGERRRAPAARSRLRGRRGLDSGEARRDVGNWGWWKLQGVLVDAFEALGGLKSKSRGELRTAAAMAGGGGALRAREAMRHLFIGGERTRGSKPSPRRVPRCQCCGTAVSLGMRARGERGRTVGQMVARSDGECGRNAWRRLGSTYVARGTAHESVVAGPPRRAYNAARASTLWSAGTRRRIPVPCPVRFRPLWPWFCSNFWTEVHQGVNSKVVDQRSLCNFYKGSIVFFSTVFA